MCMIGLESIVDVDNQGKIITASGLAENIELDHIPLQGQLRQISIKQGRVEIH